MSKNIKIIDYFTVSKPSTYNKPFSSINRIKRYINKRFGHDLIFKNVKLYTSTLKSKDIYDQYNVRKKQTYTFTTFHYNFICSKCNINFQAGYGGTFYYHKKVDWEFMSDDWDTDITRYSCNEWMIKKLLE